jgi:hypothetical protein
LKTRLRKLLTRKEVKPIVDSVKRRSPQRRNKAKASETSQNSNKDESKAIG